MEHSNSEPLPCGQRPRPYPLQRPAAPHWPGDAVAARASPDPAAGPPAAAARADAVAQVLADPELLAEVLRHACAEPRPAPGRHDGWTGERMARFLETLADTGLVSEACRAAGLSRAAAYRQRNRDRLFDAGWRAALTKARPQVADGLLERSITGTVEHYYRDGVLVGERRHYESWLGLAVLRRLDRQADEQRPDDLAARIGDDWQATLDALRDTGRDGVPALAASEVDEVDTLPPGLSASDQVWLTDDGRWRTTFPPPPGFAGEERGIWNGSGYYERDCSEAEIARLVADGEAEEAALLARAERDRDRWFATLRAPPPPAPPRRAGRKRKVYRATKAC